MLKKVEDISSQDFSGGLSTVSSIFSLNKNQSPNMMNVRVNFDGSIEKRMGTNIQNATTVGSSGIGGFTSGGGALTNNLIAFWNMNETAGTREDVAPGGGNDLSDNNSVSFANGILNNAALFVAANKEYLLINNTSTLATGDIDFSMSTWVYLNATDNMNQQTLISKLGFSPVGQNADSDTVLLIHADTSAFADASIYNHVVSTTGNAIIDTNQLKFGTASGNFDGNASTLRVPDNDVFYFGASNWTVDCWVRFNAFPVTEREAIFYHQGSDSSHGFTLYFLNSSGDVHELWITNYLVLNQGTGVILANTLTTNTWYHFAWVRSSNNILYFVDGTLQGTTAYTGDIQNFTEPIEIGGTLSPLGTSIGGYFNGWIDEYRVSHGQARWVSNFTPPTIAYGSSTTNTDFEYWLYIDTDNQVVFDVSSSGTVANGSVRATSIGALDTATWYNVIAWHDTGDTLGISVNLSVNTATYASGVREGSGPFVVGAVSNGVSSFLDGRIDETAFWKKVLTATDRTELYNAGNAITILSPSSEYTWGSFDFGASNIRWYIVAAGTALYASSNLGVTLTTFGTSQTASYHHFERSRNQLVITNDAYNNVLIWDGSGGTHASILNNSAPTARFAINHQAFLILLNTNTRKRGFYWEDELTQITGDWGDSFDLPSSLDDEVTAAFVLRNSLYVSLRERLYRLTFVGGNPDWSYKEIKNWGFVPRTVELVTIKDAGEVAVGMSWDGRIRLFDGSEDRIISDNIENDNHLCDFALEKLGSAGSGLGICHSVYDKNEQFYRLCVAIGANSTETTHFINLNLRNSAFFPESNRPFNTMVMARSDNKNYLLAGDRSGRIHLIDSGTLDANVQPINEVFDSPIYFQKSPSEISKSHIIDLYFDPIQSADLYYQDRIDFKDSFSGRDTLSFNSANLIQIKHQVDVPSTQNVYQFRLLSSSSTGMHWKLNRVDFFNEVMGVGKNT